MPSRLWRIYSFSIVAVGAAETLPSSTADFEDCCERRAFRSTEDLVHSLGADVSVILKETFAVVELVWTANTDTPQDLDTFLDVLIYETGLPPSLLFLPGFGAALSRGGSRESAAQRGLLQDEPSLCPVLRVDTSTDPGESRQAAASGSGCSTERVLHASPARTETPVGQARGCCRLLTLPLEKLESGGVDSSSEGLVTCPRTQL